MRAAARPLRFLVLVVGGWVCVRTAMLVYGGSGPEAAPARPNVRAAMIPAHSPSARDAALEGALLPLAAAQALPSEGRVGQLPVFRSRMLATRSVDRPMDIPIASASFVPAAPARPPARVPLLLHPPVAVQPGHGRWSASAWLFLRAGRGRALGNGATLGGSQSGGRLGYRLNMGAARPLMLTARIYSPLNAEGAEGALGLEWKPSASVPVRILAERRLALEEGGRSAFSLLAYGGVSGRRVAGPVLLDAYGQAGMVGLRSRDLFIDGALTLSIPVKGRVQAGIGLWGAAQPDVSRLDAGPQISVALPIPGANARLSGAWRLRLAGDAAPGSGPALTLGTDF